MPHSRHVLFSCYVIILGASLGCLACLCSATPGNYLPILRNLAPPWHLASYPWALFNKDSLTKACDAILAISCPHPILSTYPVSGTHDTVSKHVWMEGWINKWGTSFVPCLRVQINIKETCYRMDGSRVRPSWIWTSACHTIQLVFLFFQCFTGQGNANFNTRLMRTTRSKYHLSHLKQ